VQPVIPAEMIDSAVQMVVYLITVAGAFLGYLLTGRT
jgi:hypothetical protein